MRLKVSRGFKSYTDDKIVSFANTVYERMSSDSQYITLKPFVDDIKVKKDALVTGIAFAVRKDQDRRDEKNAFKVALINFLDKIAHKLEDLVEERGNNSRVITDAGFEVRNTTKKEKEPVTELDMPVLIAKDVDKKAGWASAVKSRRAGLDRSALHRDRHARGGPQACLRYADLVRRRPGTRAPPGGELEGDQRHDLGIQAAQGREVP